jgi:hypothetical protein
MSTHRAWQFDAFGPFRDVLKLREVPTGSSNA